MDPDSDVTYIKSLINGAPTITVRSAGLVGGGQPQQRIGGSLPPAEEIAQIFAVGERAPHVEFLTPFNEAPRLGQQYRLVLIPVTSALLNPLRVVDVDEATP